jgi:hypothetical protein
MTEMTELTDKTGFIVETTQNHDESVVVYAFDY